MKTLSGVIMSLVLATSLANYHSSTHNDVQFGDAGNAAYRDGIYLGRLSAKNGKPPHIAYVRWSAAQGRASFTTGYQEGYAEMLASRVDSAHANSAAFRDGLFLGSLALKQGDESHPSAGRWSTSADRELFIAGYNKAQSGATLVELARANGR